MLNFTEQLVKSAPKDDLPSQEWNVGCEAYYMGWPIHHNPHDSSNALA